MTNTDARMQPMRSSILNVAMVAERWGVSDTFVYDEIKAGRLQAFKLGNKLIRIRAEWVEEYERQATGAERGEGTDAASPPPAKPDGATIGRTIHLRH